MNRTKTARIKSMVNVFAMIIIYNKKILNQINFIKYLFYIYNKSQFKQFNIKKKKESVTK